MGSRRRGEEELLQRLQVEGIVRIGKEVGSLEWRGRRGGGGSKDRGRVGACLSVGVRGRLWEA